MPSALHIAAIISTAAISLGAVIAWVLWRGTGEDVVETWEEGRGR